MRKSPQKKYQPDLKSWSLKILLNIWTILTILTFLLDFFSGHKFNSQAGAIGIIYLAILGIYAGDKEYTRWNENFISHFLGETFIVAWTALMIMFVMIAPLSQGLLKVPAEFALVYTGVVGVFVITQRSKSLHHKRTRKN